MGLTLFSQAIASLLIAMVLGFIACVLAQKEKGLLKGWGYFVGGLTFIFSIVLLLNALIASLLVSRQFGRTLRQAPTPKRQAPGPVNPPAPVTPVTPGQ